MEQEIEIRAIHNPMQIIIITFIWIFTIFCFITLENMILNIMMFALTCGLTIWLFTVKLKIEKGSIQYSSGFLKRKIKLEQISSISSEFTSEGKNFSRECIIKSIDNNSNVIRFNVRYFTKKDFVKIMNILNDNTKQITFIESVRNAIN